MLAGRAGQVKDGEQAVLDALRAVLAEAPPAGTGWTDGLWGLYEAYEAGRSGQEQPPQLTAEQSAQFASQWQRQQLSLEVQPEGGQRGILHDTRGIQRA
ncbi:hypothetical protein N4G70_35705 [Streptomyces sp. ASQP_92]|uniref:hypothetical protein n=1 Tax=Streptomyces sp. ASQP_92 TaxID=2979116 RepID=UPI0021C23C91|nr:hypothetical protein [Streptomyces sp. ASQP_92]MCT9094152.1 hypothetical protein [Streptomyces sp. ASQP_92]